MMLEWEKGSLYVVIVNGSMSEYEMNWTRMEGNGRRTAAGTIRSNGNVKCLECARALRETFHLSVLMNWREKEVSSRIRAMQVDNLRSFLGIRRIFTVAKGGIG